MGRFGTVSFLSDGEVTTSPSEDKERCQGHGNGLKTDKVLLKNNRHDFDIHLTF
jgi:hypothetical protein